MDELKARKVSNVISKYREVDHRRMTGRCNRKIEDGKLNSSPSLMLRINLEEGRRIRCFQLSEVSMAKYFITEFTECLDRPGTVLRVNVFPTFFDLLRITQGRVIPRVKAIEMHAPAPVLRARSHKSADIQE